MSEVNFGKVAVLYGGTSSEREISLVSGSQAHKELLARGIDAHLFDPSTRPLADLKLEGFDRCFLALHGAFGEDGAIQGALQLMGIPYTGSGIMASSIGMNKVMTKYIWRAAGVSTPDYRIENDVNGVKQALLDFGAPIIVKPSHGGSSIGVSKVATAEECESAFFAATADGGSALCEVFIQGPELACAIFGPNEEPETLPIIEIRAPLAIYDFTNKYFTDETVYVTPPDLPKEMMADLCEKIKKAYTVLGCRDWARIDVMVDKASSKFYLLEINTCTGMTTHSLYHKAVRAAGMDVGDLYVNLLKFTLLGGRSGG
jgi:D-alanine-D-alanine ligase